MTKSKRALTPRILSLAKLEAGEYKVITEKSAVTLWQLRQRTSPFSKKWAPGCHARVVRQEPRRARWIFRVRCNKPESAPEGHLVRLQALPGDQERLSRRDVLVSCSCPAWRYWGADYNAYNNGYSEAIRARLDQDQGIRDPGRTYLICKHVYALGKITTNINLETGDREQESIFEWTVPETFRGEEWRRLPPPEEEIVREEEEDVGEVEPGVPEVRRPRRTQPRPTPQPSPPPSAPEPPPEQEPQTQTGPEQPDVKEEEEDEDFPVYLL